MRLPFDELTKRGHDVQHARFAEAFDETWPVLVAQRFGFPGFEMAWLKLFRKHTMVWETDDDLWAVDPVNKRAHKIFTPQFLKGLEFCVRTSRLVTVTNDHLAERMSRFNPNVRVVPNMIDAALPKMTRTRRDKVTVGWAGGDSHRRDLARIITPLHRIIRSTDAQVHTIGQDFTSTLKLPQDRHRHTGWETSLIKYYSRIDFDIGLAPLEDTLFTRSKSYVKALEYGALGIPVIASDVGPYREYVEDGVTGFLVRKESEWIDRIRLLYDDADLRERMGAAAKAKAVLHTIEAGVGMWEDVYRSVM